MAQLNNSTPKKKSRLKLITQEEESKAKELQGIRWKTGMARRNSQQELGRDRKQEGEGGVAEQWMNQMLNL